MEEQPRDEGELLQPSGEASEHENSTGSVIDGSGVRPEAQALAAEAEEIRRLVDAGAGSPEALRELAARLREHRAREEALWRAEIKPALVKENKGRLRGHGKPAAPKQEASTSNALMFGLLLLGLVLVVVIAANTTVWLLVLPVVALIAWAWKQGRDSIG